MNNLKSMSEKIDKLIDNFFNTKNLELKFARKLVNKKYAIRGEVILIFIVTIFLNLIFESIRASFGVMFGKSFNIMNVFISFNFIKYFPIYTIAYILATIIYIKFIANIRASFKEIDEGQKGTSRFATREEIDQQYKAVPIKEEEYKGKGGVPIAWGKKIYIQNDRKIIKDVMYIDDSPVNNLLLGTTRSGKGETFVVPTIDIYSRAGLKPSFIINDPKGELIAMCKDTLEKRGYDILLLNLVDPLNSMSYNPLELIKQAYKQGDLDEAQSLCKTFTTALYSESNSKENEFFTVSARALVNALILAVCDECIATGEENKITLYTVAKMLVELGKDDYKDEESGMIKNALDEYFKALPITSVARSQYASSSFASDRSRGNIFATADTKLNNYTMNKIGKLTSKNSINLKDIGFDEYFEKTIKVKVIGNMERIPNRLESISSFRRDSFESIGESLSDIDLLDDSNSKVINDFTGLKDVTVSIGITEKELKETILNGVYAYNEGGFDVTERIKICFENINLKEKLNTECEFEVILKAPKTKPKALFMVTPDYDRSNHFLTSIFVKQLYTVLAKEASISDTGKCDKEVIFLLDEAGNMPPIDDLANIVTVCLGRGIRFNLILQSYNQLKSLYGDADATIIRNCGNQIYMLSNEGNTAEEFSKLLGDQTIVTNSRSGEVFGINKTQTETLDSRKLLMGSELKLQEGETVVVRVIKRRDNQGNKITPHPIYNQGEYALKYRYEYLAKDFDNSKIFKNVKVHSEHKDLNLENLIIDFSKKKEEKSKKETQEAHEKVQSIIKESENEEEKLLETEITQNLANKILLRLKTLKVNADLSDIKKMNTLGEIVDFLEKINKEEYIDYVINIVKEFIEKEGDI